MCSRYAPVTSFEIVLALPSFIQHLKRRGGESFDFPWMDIWQYIYWISVSPMHFHHRSVATSFIATFCVWKALTGSLWGFRSCFFIRWLVSCSLLVRSFVCGNTRLLSQALLPRSWPTHSFIIHHLFALVSGNRHCRPLTRTLEILVSNTHI